MRRRPPAVTTPKSRRQPDGSGGGDERRPGRPLRPPLLARTLLRLILPAQVRDAFAGDLEERFQREAAHDPRAARRMYWRDVLSPSVLRLRRETKGSPFPPGSPPGAALHPSLGTGMLTSLATDLRFALRMMRKAPAFTAVAVLSLALGIGPNTAIFSMVDTVLFQKWGVRNPDSLVDVYGLTRDNRHVFTNWRVYELVRDGAADAFASVAASSPYTGAIESDGAAEMVLGEMVTGNYFDVLGVPAERGRTFLPEEDATPGTHPVVVLADRFWRSHYGADPNMVGGQIRLNGRPYTVVGIAPPSFKGRIAPAIGSDFWVPFSMWTHLTPDQKGQGNFLIMGRMKPGVPGQQAQPVLDAVASRYNAQHPESRSKLRLGAVPLSSILLSPDTDRTIEGMALLLFAAVGMVLVIACVNLAGFLLARAADRRKEMAVRLAIGAGRGSLVRQLLVETLVLAGLGGALGLALGQIFLRVLLSADLPLPMPVHLHAALDGRLVAFTVAVSLIASAVFGLTPALNAVRVPLASTLRDEAASGGGRGKARSRQILVGAQMTVCTVLLFGAGLFVRNLRGAADTDVGFSTGPAGVATAETSMNQYSDKQEAALVDDVVREVSAEPGVSGVAATRRLPLDLGESNVALDIPGVAPPPNANHIVVEITEVSPDYFSVMGIPLVEGRAFNDGDTPDGQPVIVISRAMARRFWPDQSAVGKVVYLDADPRHEAVVVGVVGNVKIWSLSEPPRPYVYAPIAQRGGYGSLHFVARGALPPMELAGRIRDAAKQADPTLVLSDVGTMADHLGYILFLPRMAALLLSLAGALALVLGCVGLYGMVSYAAARRTREMGIRIALGADRGQVTTLVVRSGLTVVAVGGVVGIAVSLALSGAVRGFLIGVGALDPIALAAAPTVLALVALAAAWLPARRAGRVDPVEALRIE